MFQLPRPLLYRFLVFIVLAASLTACGGMDRQPHPDNKPQFAAGWSEHARPLLFHGIGRDPGYTVWQVPNILPHGTYRVIVREGDTAEFVDGLRFDVDAPEKDIYLNILASYANPEALDEKYIVGLDGAAVK